MNKDFTKKMSVEEIRKKFESDDVVRRFSDLETGQVATVDAALNLEIVAESAGRIVPNAKNVLDIGCGAGNYTLKLLSKLPDLNCTLVDLSAKMLKKSLERIRPKTKGEIVSYQEDIRKINLPVDRFDIVLAAAVLHHLRDEKEWVDVFRKIYDCVSPGGYFVISDLIVHANPTLEKYMWERFETYVRGRSGPETFEQIRSTIDKEDTPRPVLFQLELLEKVGFKNLDVLHKNGLFATFGGIK
ncbi:MAG: class I SAM-dependent methyltransferase [Candidatus Kryptoniota bacterium]